MAIRVHVNTRGLGGVAPDSDGIRPGPGGTTSESHASTPEPDGSGSFHVTCPPGLLEDAVRAVFASEGLSEAELSLTLLDDAEIRDLNSRYLQHDRPTDVIAFPMYESGDTPMGDVYIGYEQALRQAAELGIEPREELVRLVIHGTLHVLGYDHPKSADREESPMWQKQERLLARVMAGWTRDTFAVPDPDSGA